MASTPVGKVRLYRIRIGSQGYSYGKFGRYYGIGWPVYIVHDDEDFEEEFRAQDREHAKDILKKKYPGIQFCKE